MTKKYIGCDDPYHTQDDGCCLCSDCSFGDDESGCLQFRKENKLVLKTEV